MNGVWGVVRVPRRAVITRRKCNAKDNMRGRCKHQTIRVLQTLINHFPLDEGIIAIKLLRTDTTLDLSQEGREELISSIHTAAALDRQYLSCCRWQIVLLNKLATIIN
jgi:hypothetical protein